jgi:hypothetical protein
MAAYQRVPFRLILWLAGIGMFNISCPYLLRYGLHSIPSLAHKILACKGIPLVAAQLSSIRRNTPTRMPLKDFVEWFIEFFRLLLMAGLFGKSLERLLNKF